MDKGIRPACNAKFLAELPSRVNTREGNVAFRKNVMGAVMEDFGITLASAATHYNHAFINAKEVAKTDAVIEGLLQGLGRPEDKKGGRKPKAKPEAAVAPVGSGSEYALGIPASDNGDEMTGTLLSEGIVENTSTQTVTINPEAPAVVLHDVRKKSDGSVIATGLTLEAANELIAKAKQAKKASLELVA
jgi:hypothetical protein